MAKNKKEPGFVKWPYPLDDILMNRRISELNPEYKGKKKLTAGNIKWLQIFQGYCAGTNKCYLSPKHLAEKFRCSQTTVINNVKPLKDAGLMRVLWYKVEKGNGKHIQKFRTHEQCVAIVQSKTGWDHTSTDYWVIKPEQILQKLAALIPDTNKNQKTVLIEGRPVNERLTIENFKRKQIVSLINLSEGCEYQAGIDPSNFFLGKYYLSLMKSINEEKATFVESVSERFISDKEFIDTILKKFEIIDCIKMLDVVFDIKSKNAISWIDKDSLLKFWADEKYEMKFRLALRGAKQYRHEEQSAWTNSGSTKEVTVRRC